MIKGFIPGNGNVTVSVINQSAMAPRVDIRLLNGKEDCRGRCCRLYIAALVTYNLKMCENCGNVESEMYEKKFIDQNICLRCISMEDL